MDRSAMPWRALEDAPVEAAAQAGSGGQEASPGLVSAQSWRVAAGIALAAILAIGAFVVAASASTGSIELEGGSAWSATGSSRPVAGSSVGPDGFVVVDVQGAVLHPGAQRLDSSARVGDAIAAAGGYGPRVDAERTGRELNLAAPLRDGDRVVVPSRDDPPGAGAASAATGGGSSELVDLNSATAAQLDALPGIGPVTAQKIIDARAERPFASVGELRERKIVGASTFDKLRDLITVR
jgi:competence protein ComEA